MVFPEIRDKDGVSGYRAARSAWMYLLRHRACLQVSALAVFATLAAETFSSGKTLSGYLASLYDTYGQFVTLNSYWICHEPATITRLFDALRVSHDSSYPVSLGEWKIASIRDVTTGYDSTTPDKKLRDFPVDPKTQMLSFSLETSGTQDVDGLIGTVRTSGTEPKTKYYLEGWGSDRKAVEAALQRVRDAIGTEWLHVEKEGLLSPA